MKKIIFIIVTMVFTTTIVSAIGPTKSGHHRSNVQYSIPEGMDISELDIADGTYQGTATGFSPELTVEIVLEKGELISVEVISHNEIGSKYYSTPIKYIPGFIVKKQQTEVDAVSGATATSKAIMSAVEDALSKAMENIN